MSSWRWGLLAMGVQLGALACGDQVTVIGGAGGAGATTGSGGTTSSSSSTTSSTGASGGGFTTGTTTTLGCPIIPEEDLYTMEVNGDGGPLVLTTGCDELLPFLTIGGGGECSEGATLHACGVGNEPELSLYAPGLTDVGTATGVSVYYRREGQSYQASDGTTTLLELPEVGAGAIGSYAASVVGTSDPSDVLSLSGAFVLCRMPDPPPCP